MIEILRDTAWASVLAFAGIVVVVVIYFAQRSRKGLSYEILTESALLSVAHGIAGKVQILYDGKQVRNVHLLLIKFTNSGNVPILPSDFIEPLWVTLGETAAIISLSLEGTSPSSLSVQLNNIGSKKEEGKIVGFRVAPTLLNSGDSFVVRALVSGYTQSVKVQGRIIGVKEIEFKGRRTGTERSRHPRPNYRAVHIKPK